MLIKEITLHKSKRLGFNGIETMTYTPDNIHQIILGSNGSGKSSLMAELSPLPSSGNDYFKGGFKLIKIDHRGKQFELMSDFTQKSSGRHSFLIGSDKKELNDGGTVTVQKQLVKEYFELDQDLFDLLTGVTSFREMSPNLRRYWLVRMADDNMEYAIKLYNDINKRARDAQAVVKYHDGRLANETNRVPDINLRQQELTERQTQLRELHRALTRIVGGKEDFRPEEHLRAAQNVNATLMGLTDDVLSKSYLVGNPITDPDQISVIKARLSSKLETLVEQISNLNAEHRDIKQTVDAIVSQGAKDLDSLSIKLQDVKLTKQEHLNKINMFKDIRKLDGRTLQTVTDNVSKTFNDILTNLPDNSSGYFVRAEYVAKQKEKESLFNKLDAIGPDIKKYEHLLYHLTNTQHAECPKCNTSFIPGMAKYDIEDIRDKVNKYRGFTEDTNKQIADIDTYLTEVSDYLRTYRTLTQLMDNTIALKPLWDVLATIKLTEYSPNKYLSMFEIWQDEVNYLVQAMRLDPDIAAMEEAISRLGETTNNESKYNQKSLDNLSSRISDLTLEQTKTQGRIQYVDNLHARYIDMKELEERIVRDTSKLEISINQYEKDALFQFIDDEIQNLNTELGKVSIELNQLEVTRQLINDLTKRREEAARQLEILTLISKEMSPASGLIADHSLKFITQFTDQMNRIINSIWTYDMQLLPLAMSEDLTYKFPLYMSESDTETPDINKASTAQKSVIDFAFKILLITYLKLEDYPLWLDELPVGFDEHHRIRLLDYVKEHVEGHRCSQMFMISHNQEAHLTFHTADVVVINAMNLLNKPLEYNTGVVFEYG